MGNKIQFGYFVAKPCFKHFIQRLNPDLRFQCTYSISSRWCEQRVRQGQDKKTAEARRRPHCGGGGRHLCRNLVARVPPLPFHEIFSAAVALLLLRAAPGEQVLACMETFLSRIDPRVLAQSQYSVYQLLTQYYSLLTGLAARKSRIVRESCYSQSIRYSSPMYHNEVETLMKSNWSLSQTA